MDLSALIKGIFVAFVLQGIMMFHFSPDQLLLATLSCFSYQGCGLVNAKLDEFYWEWPGVLSCLELNLKRSGANFKSLRLMQPESVQLIRQIIHNAEDPTAEAWADTTLLHPVV